MKIQRNYPVDEEKGDKSFLPTNDLRGIAAVVVVEAKVVKCSQKSPFTERDHCSFLFLLKFGVLAHKTHKTECPKIGILWRNLPKMCKT